MGVARTVFWAKGGIGTVPKLIGHPVVTGSGLWPRSTLIVCHLCPWEALVCHRHRAKSARPGCSKSRESVLCASLFTPTQIKSEPSPCKIPCWTRCASASWPAWASPLATKRPTPGGRHQPRRRRAAGKHARRRGAGPAGDRPSADRQALAAGRDAARPPCSGTSAAGSALAPTRSPLLSEMPSLPRGATSPLLWLDGAGPSLARCLVCPLKPDGAHKRALWQQCRQRHTLDAHDHGTAMVSIASLNPVRVTMSDLLPHFRPLLRIGLRSHLPHRAGRPPGALEPGQPALLLRAALSQRPDAGGRTTGRFLHLGSGGGRQLPDEHLRASRFSGQGAGAGAAQGVPGPQQGRQGRGLVPGGQGAGNRTAINLYESEGFAEYCRRADYYGTGRRGRMPC